MSQLDTRIWLERKVRQEKRLSIGGFVLLVAIGTVTVFFTFWMIYGIVWFGFHWFIPLTHTILLMTSTVVVLLLFVGNATTDRRYLDEIDIDIGPGRQVKVAALRIAGYGSMTAFTDLKTTRSSLKMITTLLYTGPRMFTDAFRLLMKVSRLRSMDVTACAQVFKLLLRADERVPFSVIVEKYPHMDPAIIFPQLKLIEGVVFLTKENPGLVLAPLLRDEVLEFTEDKHRRH